MGPHAALWEEDAVATRPVCWAGHPGPTSGPSRAAADDVAHTSSLTQRLTLSRCWISSVSVFRHLSR